MSVFYEKYNPDQLPPEELSDREKKLLQAQLNQDRVLRWRQLAGPQPKTIRTIFMEKKWVWLAVLLFLATILCWQAGWFSNKSTSQHPLMAARTDLLNYPFDNLTVRGSQDAQQLMLPAKALEAYRLGDFETALHSAGTTNHFFNGICWLQLKNPQKALYEFELQPINDRGVGDEFFYYKGVALQDLGRKEEAKKAFQQILESRTVREPFRAEVAKRMNSL